MVAIVTGASSGFGSEVCKQLVKKGHKVYGISRRKLAPPGVTAYSADVSDASSVRAIVDEIAQKEGRIDLLIANAGMGISGPVELTAEEVARRIKHNDSGINEVDSAEALYPGCDKAVASMEKDERTGLLPEQVASVIVRVACKKNPAPLYVAGCKYRFILVLYSILPTRIAVWLVGKFYLRSKN